MSEVQPEPSQTPEWDWGPSVATEIPDWLPQGKRPGPAGQNLHLLDRVVSMCFSKLRKATSQKTMMQTTFRDKERNINHENHSMSTALSADPGTR